MCSTDDEGAWGHFEVSLTTSEKAEKCYECDREIPAGTFFTCIETWDEDQCGGEGEGVDEDGEPNWYGDDEPRPDEKPTVYEVHAACSALSDFVRDHICKTDHDIEQKAKGPRDFYHHFHGYIPLGGLGQEIEELVEYSWALTPEDAGDAYAMGFEVAGDGEVVERKEGVSLEFSDGMGFTGCPGQVAEWLQGLIAAEYSGVAA